MSPRVRLCAASAASVLAFASQAQAQAAGQTLIEELVVTAEKREQSLQDVPVAVSAFTSEKRELIGITTVTDMTNYTPGLTYSSGTDRITLRGIGRLTNNLASEPGVANYSDGVYSSSTVTAGASPLFIQRVEVLRGPQGTLYGRNSIGGAINVISKRPDDTFGGEVRVTVANYDRQVYEGIISIPLTEGLRAQFSASRIDQDEGFFKNLAGGPDEGEIREQNNFEGQIEADLGEDVTVWLKYGQGQYNNRAAPGGRGGGSFAPPEPLLFGLGSLSPSASYGFVGGANLNALGPVRGNAVLESGDAWAFSSNIPNENDLENQYLTAEVSWNLSSAQLKYIGGYSKYDYELTTDYDNTAVLSYQVPLTPGGRCAQLALIGACRPLTVNPNVVSVYEEHKKWWSHELNLASTTDGPLQWIVGAFYYRENYTQPVTLTLPDQVQFATPLGGAPNPQRIVYYTNQDMEMTSKAAFAQIDWSFAETFKLTAGLRYTKDEKSGTEETRQLCFGLPSCLAAVAPLFGVTPANANIPQLGSLTPVLDITNSVAAGTPPAGSTDPQKGVVGPAVTDPLTGVRSRRLADSWDEWTGTLGLEWKPDTDTLAYAKYSRGYKAGGFNSGTIQAYPETDAETVDAYELGLKKDWTPRLQTNISLFYYAYDKAQVPVQYQPDTGPRVSLFFNIPKSISQGIELETTWAPIDNLRILFNYAYLDAHIDEACCISDPDDPTASLPTANPAGPPGAIDAPTGLPTRAQDVSGQKLPLSPKHKVALNALYTWQFGPGALTGSASYLWRDEVYASIFNSEANRAPGRDQIDLRLTWTDSEDRYSIVGYVQNLADEDDFETLTASRNSVGNIYQTFVMSPPRTYGVQLQYRF